ncbi:hypothetical protein [Sphingobacterium spiritivorum]|uniref:hypothetical protein n=1 Tax=Sphingobacterium spiritivorum TaxID=258 RepID=UPI001919C30A|nr:hypothetical protein [Sphingobacterium spiritivorum]QQT25058.1 hypothetical protein I6J02_15175 [Sphingobacterium spiritivorum]
MNRKKFIKNSLLASGSILLPNSILAFGTEMQKANNTSYRFLSVPNPNRFKLANNGTKFFESSLSIMGNRLKLDLGRKYFVSENTNGFATPCLLQMQDTEHWAFVPELYKDQKVNGFIVKMCDGLPCEETKIFTH